jgi:formylglycine-generating enzyme required for sulfatase activity
VRHAPVPRRLPALDDCVTLPAGTYRLGERGDERDVELAAALVGRYPVACAHAARFVAESGHGVPDVLARMLADPELADHPATGLTYADAEAFCAWASGALDRHVRLPTGDEWEAVARGTDGRDWPWGDTYEPERCNGAEASWGWTVPVTAHPAGVSALGAEDLAGNAWEWVSDAPADGWRLARGGCWLDTAWGLRATRALSADPARGTNTTGLRIAIDHSTEQRRQS